jgi:signal recognition particle GTPase
VSPQNIVKNLDNIMANDNYKFYSISMVVFGGLGPQGLGFTYSTPKGEIIEICSDQKETEAIIIKFRQYLKRKFLAKLENEMERLGVKPDIIIGITSYLSEILNPEDLVSYNDMGSILKKIKNLLDYEFQQYKFELDEIMSKISNVFSKIYSRKIKIWFKLFFNRRVLGKLEKEMVKMDVNADIRRRIKKYLADSIKPKDFFKYYDDNSISEVIGKLLSDEFQQLSEEIISKTSKAVSLILRQIKLKDQFKTRMDLVVEGKIKSEDIAKLTSLRGKSHYDVLRERFFFQYIVNWFYEVYVEEKGKFKK